MNIEQVGPVGAVITGIDLKVSEEISINEIKEAFLKYSVLIFKNQKLDPADLRNVSLIWGEPLIHPVFKGIENYPEIIQIQNLGEKYHTNAHWHSDVTFEEEPPDATLLYSLEIPDEGGDTLFADQYLAYEELPEVLKEELKETVAIHSNLGVLMLAGGDINNLSEVEHPVFRNHPETRKKSLFVTEAFVKELKEADPKYSEETLSRLYKHSSKNDYVYRHKWTKGDLVVWDNRCVLHYAEHGYGNKKRTMHRITTSGSKPF
ncbi:MAG TPA: TauD/TfdA family dioxygenase [SAR86 cluster bacterium]|jgi:taurine dioxygenase|nr:TauD/TfdA family dioxygenase [SAR86 cluster bacterium]